MMAVLPQRIELNLYGELNELDAKPIWQRLRRACSSYCSRRA